MLSLLAARDFQGYRRAASSLLESTRDPVDPSARNSIAWFCVIGPGVASDFDEPLRQAEAALKAIPADQRGAVLNTLGAAQCRAGRREEAIKTLEESIEIRKGQSVPEDWAFLAMAHHRLGHHDQARLWLERFKTWKRSEPGFRWSSLEIELLEREARSLVLAE
jgi:tetratricopeptide (TPR) repeat protein